MYIPFDKWDKSSLPSLIYDNVPCMRSNPALLNDEIEWKIEYHKTSPTLPP